MRSRPTLRQRTLAIETVHDPTIGHVDGPARLARKLDVVGDEHDRAPGVRQAPEQREDLGRRRGIEVAGRFVRDQDRRVVRECPGDRDPLLLAARGGQRELISLVAHLDELEELRGPCPPFPRRTAPGEVHRQHHVLGHGQRRDQLEELEHDPDVPAPPPGEIVLGRPAQVQPGDRDGAASLLVDAGHDVEQRGLAAPGTADDRDQLARRDLQRHAAERPERPRAGRVILHYVAEVDDRRGLRGVVRVARRGEVRGGGVGRMGGAPGSGHDAGARVAGRASVASGRAATARAVGRYRGGRFDPLTIRASAGSSPYRSRARPGGTAPSRTRSRSSRPTARTRMLPTTTHCQGRPAAPVSGFARRQDAPRRASRSCRAPRPGGVVTPGIRPRTSPTPGSSSGRRGRPGFDPGGRLVVLNAWITSSLVFITNGPVRRSARGWGGRPASARPSLGARLSWPGRPRGQRGPGAEDRQLTLRTVAARGRGAEPSST